MFKKLILSMGLIVVLMSASMAAALNGAGATFPYPIYSKWMAEYRNVKGVEINYASIGSGGGVRQFTAGVVDFRRDGCLHVK